MTPQVRIEKALNECRALLGAAQTIAAVDTLPVEVRPITALVGRLGRALVREIETLRLELESARAGGEGAAGLDAIVSRVDEQGRALQGLLGP